MSEYKRKVIFSTVINTVYAAVNFFLALDGSYWFFALGVYYALLSIMRVVALLFDGRACETRVSRSVGTMLSLSVLPLLVTVVISSFERVATKYHEIVMITIALYAFFKITLAIINILKAAKLNSCTVKILRSISLADALVSIAALQRSMLVSFGEMPENNIKIFNMATGSVVCIIVLIIGIRLVLENDKK